MLYDGEENQPGNPEGDNPDRPFLPFREGYFARQRSRNDGLLPNLANETIASPRYGLDESGIFRRVAQRLSDFVDGGVQIVIDVNEGVRPQTLLKLLPRNHGAWLLQQNRQHLERLA